MIFIYLFFYLEKVQLEKTKKNINYFVVSTKIREKTFKKTLQKVLKMYLMMVF